MQNNIQHRITGLLNAYKRNRRWKILTIILSVAVLCNTFYAMRQAAVAVTEQNAETSQIDQILGIEGQQTTGQETVAPGTGGSIETVPAPTPTPVATDPLPTTPVGTDPATTDPVITGGGEATTDPAVIPETGATDPSGAGITGSIGGLIVPEGEEVILPADAYGTTPAEYDEYGNPIYPEEAPIAVSEWIEQEAVVGETIVKAGYYSDAFDFPVVLMAEEIKPEQDEVYYEQVKRAVEEAAAKEDDFVAEGFVAFDVCFIYTDEYGYEYELEPAEGSPVQVSFTMDGKETPDVQDVAEILHLKEKDGVFEAERMYAEIDVYGETAEFITDSFSPIIITQGAGNQTRDAAVKANIESARATGFRILDASGNPVRRARTNDAVTAEISWVIDDLNEIDAANDFIEIQLPAGLEFPEVTGSFVITNKEYDYTHKDGTVERLWPGANVYVYTIRNGMIRVEYWLAATYLRELGKLTEVLGGANCSTIRVENVRVAATSANSPYTPEVRINNTNASALPIQIQGAQAGRINLDTISLRVNGSPGGRDITVGTEDVLKLDVLWEKTSGSSIQSGDYFDVFLPENLEFESSNRAMQDEYGNMYRYQVSRSNDRWMLRVIYEDVQPGSSRAMGYAPIPYAAIKTPPVFNGNSSANMLLTARLEEQNKTATATITVLNQSSSINEGTWRIRGKKTSSYYYGEDDYVVYDYIVGGANTYPLLAPSPMATASQLRVKLYVVADHGGKLDAEPFGSTSRIDWNTKQYASNYKVAYCASSYASSPTMKGETYSSNYSQYQLLPIEGAGLTYSQIEKLKNIMSTAYPYVSLEVMANNLGYSRISEDVAVCAVQGAIWRVVNGSASANYGNKTTTINNLISNLISYSPSASSYSFNGEPKITFSGNTATVTGRIRSTPAGEPVKGLTGTFSGGSQSVSVTPDENGYFSATLSNVSKTDIFHLHFSGSVMSMSKVIYFDNTYAASRTNEQDLIAAEASYTPVNLDWEYQGKDVTRKVKVIKRWQDANGNLIEGWPEGVTVEVALMRGTGDNTPVMVDGSKVTLSSRYPEHVWSELPATDQSGNVYIYTVSETKVPEGYEIVDIERGTDPSEPAMIVYTATNRKTEEKTKVKVVKKWPGMTNEEAAERDLRIVVQLFRHNPEPNTKTGIRWNQWSTVANDKTQGLVVTGKYRTKVLYEPFDPVQDGEEVMVTLTAENNWTVTFEDLPVTDEEGNKLQYLIREMAVYEGSELQENFAISYGSQTWPDRMGRIYACVDMKQDVPLVTISNTRPDAEIIVTKEWKQIVNGQETALTENLPPYITAVLSARDNNGKEIPEDLLKQKYVKLAEGEKLEVPLNAENNWTYTWKVYPMDGISFYIKEAEVPAGYTGPEDAVRFVKVDEKKYVATLKNVKETEEVTVVKEWSGLTDPAELDGLQIRVGLFRQHSDGSVTPVRWYPNTGEGRRVLSKTPDYVLGGTYNVDKNGTGDPVEDNLVAGINWRVTYRDLPKYDGNERIHYVVKEIGVPSGFSVSYKQGVTVKDGLLGLSEVTYGDTVERENGGLEATIVNTAAGTLRVVKKWVHGDNNEEWKIDLPEEIVVTLSATLNGSQVEPATLAKYVNGTLEDGQVKAHLTDENNWSFEWSNVQDLRGLKYFITEAQIEPDDYELIDEKGNVIDRNTPIEVKKNKEGVFEVTLTNRRKPTKVNLIKWSGDVKKPDRLKGARFALYLINGDEPSNTTNKTLIGDDYITVFDGSMDYGVRDGVVVFKNILYNRYYLVEEVEAPSGYKLPTPNPTVVFCVTRENGKDKLELFNSSVDANGVAYAALYETVTMTIRFYNNPKTYELPEAGGVGTKGYMAGGMSLITATLLMYMTLKFMQKTRKRGASK